MKKLVLLLSLIINLYIFEARSEYRVYQYYVKNKSKSLLDQKPYLVTSTLDPTSYLTFHGGSDSIHVDMLRTWMCYGYTGNRETCNSPYEQMETSRNTASEGER